MWKILIVFCILTIRVAIFDKVNYEGYKVFSVFPKLNSHLELFKEMKKLSNFEFTFWQESSIINKEVLIMVPPRNVKAFCYILNNLKINFNIKIDNIQNLINKTIPQYLSHDFDFNNYHTLEVIYNNLEKLVKKYSNRAQIIIGGTTYEGRQIKGVKITSDEEKLGIFIEGGSYAREWTSTSTVMYILHQLLSSNDSDIRYLVDSHNWFIFPIINPDGYVYSHVKDRLWRKNRKPINYDCVGTDLNRNWNFYWNSTSISYHPCDEDYPGNNPFSEIETKSMLQYIKSNIYNFNSYISFNGFSRRLMFPFSYKQKRTHYYTELYRIGSAVVKTFEEKYDTRYDIGSTGEFYEVSGLSTDYIANDFKKMIVFTYEMNDENKYCFLIPPEQIIPNGQKAMDFLVAVFKTLLSGYMKI